MDEDYEFVDRSPPSFERVVWFVSSFDYVSVFFLFFADLLRMCNGVFIWLSG